MDIATTIGGWFAGLVVGAVLTVMLTIILQDRIHWALARLFGGIVPRASRNVEGIWRARYTYESDDTDGKIKEERQIIELRQIGRQVWGRNLTGRKH